MEQNLQKKRLLVAGAFIIKYNSVLLAMRKNVLNDNGLYSLIGGKVEIGESIHMALIREIYEEVGIIVTPSNMNFMHCISFKRENGDEITSFDFMVTKWKGNPFNKEHLKHSHINWFDLNKLPENILHRHKHAYDLYKKGIYYSALGWEL